MSRLKAIGYGKIMGQYDCYVLDGGVRVLSKRGLVGLLSSGRESGNLETYLSALPRRYAHLAAGANIDFHLPGGRVGHAVDVDRVVDILQAYDEADDADELRANQRHLAKNARRIMRSCTKLGMMHLIDEATGYDAIRKRGELSRIFADDMQRWKRTFDAPLVARLCELGLAGDQNRKWSGGVYPAPLANTFRRIYDIILGKDAGRALKERNPEPRGGRNHHQWLTDEAHEVFRRNVNVVEFCASQSSSRREFLDRLNAHYSGQRTFVFA